jgi:hypothetical protein
MDLRERIARRMSQMRPELAKLVAIRSVADLWPTLASFRRKNAPAQRGGCWMPSPGRDFPTPG